MLNLGTLNIGIKADGKAAKSELDSLQKSTKDVEQSTEQATDKMGQSWSDLGTKIKTGLAVGVTAAAAAIGSLVGIANESAEDFGKLDTAFSQAGFSAEAASGTFKGFVGLLGETDTAVEASNHLAKLCDTEEQLSQWTTIAAGVFATFGDSLPLEGLTEAANETAKVGTVTGQLADALNWAGVNEDEFNSKLAACNSEAERAQLITDTLNGLYKDAGNQYLENNQALVEYRQAQAEMNQALSDLGTALMPIITEITNFGVALLNGAKPAIDALKENLPAIKQTFIDLVPAIAAVVTGIVAFQAAMAISTVIQTVTTAINAFRTAAQATTIAQAALNAVMAANPFVLVVTIIASLVAAIITLWNTNEGFRNAVTAAWNQIQATASAVWGAVVNFFTVSVPNAIQSVITWFQQLPGNISSALSSALSSISSWVSSTVAKAREAGSQFLNNVASFFSQLPGRIGGFLSSVISSIAAWASNMASQAAQAASNFGSRLISGLASLPGQVVSIGSQIISGLVNGIVGAAGQVVGAITSAVGGAINAAKSMLGIASPSKLFKSFGGYTMEGFEIGVTSNISEVEKTMREAGARIGDAFSVTTPNLTGSYNAYQAQFGSRAKATAASGYVNNSTVTVNNYSPKSLSEKESAREFRRSMRQMAISA